MVIGTDNKSHLRISPSGAILQHVVNNEEFWSSKDRQDYLIALSSRYDKKSQPLPLSSQSSTVSNIEGHISRICTTVTM